MKPHHILLIPLVASLLGAPALVASPAAAASGATEYDCSSDLLPTPEKTKLAVSVKLPKSARPGQEVKLGGKLTITLGPVASRQLGWTMAKESIFTSDSIALDVDDGAGKRRLLIRDLKSQPGANGETFKATAKFKLPAIVVPDDVSEVKLSLPAEPVVVNRTRASIPENVAYNFRMIPQDSILPVFESEYGCVLPEGKKKAATIGTIAVSGSPVEPKSGDDDVVDDIRDTLGGSAPPAGGDGGALGDSGAGGGAESGEAPSEDEADSLLDDTAPAAADPEAELSSAPIPPQTKIGGIMLPTWLLILGAAMLPTAGLIFSVISRRRSLQKAKGTAS